MVLLNNNIRPAEKSAVICLSIRRSVWHEINDNTQSTTENSAISSERMDGQPKQCQFERILQLLAWAVPEFFSRYTSMNYYYFIHLYFYFILILSLYKQNVKKCFYYHHTKIQIINVILFSERDLTSNWKGERIKNNYCITNILIINNF